MSVMILWVLLKYPFLMKLMPSMLMAMMPLWMMLTEMNFLKSYFEIFAIAPTLDCPIILLKYPTPENFPLIKAQCDGLNLSYDPKNRVENNTCVLVGHEQIGRAH